MKPMNNNKNKLNGSKKISQVKKKKMPFSTNAKHNLRKKKKKKSHTKASVSYMHNT